MRSPKTFARFSGRNRNTRLISPRRSTKIRQICPRAGSRSHLEFSLHWVQVMADKSAPQTPRRRAGRPPAGARAGEMVKDYPQLSIRLPVEMKARLNALSAVTGLAQWRVFIVAIQWACCGT